MARSEGRELGFLALVLHAHLPYVRHPEHGDSLEENWLFEAITETYIPLFLTFENLVADGIDFRLTLSVTPTLAQMLGDSFLQSRYLRKLERQMELAAKEVARTRSDPMFGPVAQMYQAMFARAHHTFTDRYGRNLLHAFRRFQDLGKIELIASAATHGYLPLLSIQEEAARTQIRVGVEYHRRTFGQSPNGFWLPECGYSPGLDRLLAEQGIRFTILETHGITRADSRPRYGIHAPLFCPSGVAAFGRDPDSSRQVWSSVEGYPGDFDYREFYRDIGHDLDIGYIRPYIHPDDIRIDTGFKYYRITGKGEHKEPYVPERAARKAELHAGHFLAERIKQVKRLSGMMDRQPLVVAPYDAELFGHWWFEGPRWLDYFIRKAALEQDKLRLVTLTEYLDRYPVNQEATPAMSSWGDKGLSEVWLNEKNRWIYPHLHQAAETLRELASARPAATGLMFRALNQAARELLLAQSSDWAFMINSGAMEQYASARTRDHLLRFQKLKRDIEEGAIDETWLEETEGRDPVFPGIHVFRDFRVAPRPALPPTLPEQMASGPRRTGAPVHIAMVSPEVAPFAKTGGLADMVGSLAAALEESGAKVSVVLPGYRSAYAENRLIRDIGTIGRRIPVYLIGASRYFDREHLYGGPQSDYADNAERFAFFCRAALELLGQIGPPDILHAHDWQAALAIAFLKTQPERYPGLAAVRTVFSVHNPGYQGLFPPEKWECLGLDRGLFTVEGLEFFGKINLLKGGVLFADSVTTVSPTYAEEIRTTEHGFGMEGIFNRRAGSLRGILNGVDYSIWNPATDPFLARNYDARNPAGKAACKAALQRAFQLAMEPDIPLIGMVSRLVSQKGFDLLEKTLERLLERNLQLVILGAGELRYANALRAAAANHPTRMAVRVAFDETLAHQIEGGADLFLMPSRYEPGGLSQLYSLKYGTIPIVRATGGLKDSVREFDPGTGAGTGFTFVPYTAEALLETVDRALAVFHGKDCWRILMRNAMAADFSWRRSAREYLSLYEELLES